MPPEPPPIAAPRGLPARRRAWFLALAALIVAGIVAAVVWLVPLGGSGRYGAPLEVAAKAGVVLVATQRPDGTVSVRALEPMGSLDRAIYEGVGLTQMRVSPDGRYALLAARDTASGSNNCTMVDLRGERPSVPIVPEAVPGSGLGRPIEVTSADWLSDGRAAFSLLYDPTTIVITTYDPDTQERALIAEVPNCTWLSLFCPHGASEARAMGLADLTDLSGVVTLDERGAHNATGYPGSHWGIASPDGDSVLIQETAGSRAWTVYPVTEGDLGPGTGVDTPPVYYTCADWSPSGDRLVIGPGVYDAATGRRRATLSIAGGLEDVWFVDENHVLALAGGRVVLAKADGTGAEVLVHQPLSLPSSGGAIRSLRRWIGF